MRFAHIEEKKGAKSDLGELGRHRWNVVDLVTVIGKRALPAYLFFDIDMRAVECLKGRFLQNGRKLTVTAMLLKAIALAQRDYPSTRSAILPWGQVVTFEDVTAGVTVERIVDGKSSVFFGTISHPDRKSLSEIMEELESFAEDNVASHPELRMQRRFSRMNWLVRRGIVWLGILSPTIRLHFLGATFGISSLGKYGVTSVAGPCVCSTTFGVGAIEDRVVSINSKPAIGKVMSVSVGYDQRVVDGGVAARFGREVVRLMEGGMTDFTQEAAHALST